MKELEPSKFSRLMTYQRTMRCLSRDAMGDLLGVSGKTIERWEKGLGTPSMEYVVRICNEFNLSLEEVFEGLMETNGDICEDTAATDIDIERLNSEIANLKAQLITMQKTGDELLARKKDENDLTWFWLLITHLVATTINFLGQMMSRTKISHDFWASLLYVIIISCLIYRNRDNQKSLRLFILYTVFIEVNLLVNFVLFYDVSPDVILNIELALFNGAVYGLRMFDYNNMTLLLCICLIVYNSWIVFCGYHLIKNRKTVIV